MAGEVSITLEPGPMTAWAVAYDDIEEDGLLDILDLGSWLDRIIRQAHRAGRRVKAAVIEPSPAAGLMTRTAARVVRDTLDIYETVEVKYV